MTDKAQNKKEDGYAVVLQRGVIFAADKEEDIRPEKPREVWECTIQIPGKKPDRTIWYIMAVTSRGLELEACHAIGGHACRMEDMIHGKNGWERLWPKVEKQI